MKQLETLHAWAQLLAQLRRFFDRRGLLEVQTALARGYEVTDPHQRCFQVTDEVTGPAVNNLFLQPSPESAMKQLLAAGSGSIYQICKAFRAGEQGSNHLPEFTMLEWYRVGYDHLRLMDEVAELVIEVLGPRPVKTLTWREAFIRHAHVDPVSADLEQMAACLPEQMRPDQQTEVDEQSRRRLLWDLLLISRVESSLGRDCLTFIYDYPAEQAALARVRNESWPVAERFELYIEGIEIANGFYELNDADEQRRRFERDNQQRRKLGLSAVAVDEPLLDCLDQLPDCAGVALGVDRLLKICTGAMTLADNSGEYEG